MKYNPELNSLIEKIEDVIARSATHAQKQAWGQISGSFDLSLDEMQTVNKKSNFQKRLADELRIYTRSAANPAALDNFLAKMSTLATDINVILVPDTATPEQKIIEKLTADLSAHRYCNPQLVADAESLQELINALSQLNTELSANGNNRRNKQVLSDADMQTLAGLRYYESTSDAMDFLRRLAEKINTGAYSKRGDIPSKLITQKFAAITQMRGEIYERCSQIQAKLASMQLDLDAFQRRMMAIAADNSKKMEFARLYKDFQMKQGQVNAEQARLNESKKRDNWYAVLVETISYVMESGGKNVIDRIEKELKAVDITDLKQVNHLIEIISKMHSTVEDVDYGTVSGGLFGVATDDADMEAMRAQMAMAAAMSGGVNAGMTAPGTGASVDAGIPAAPKFPF